MPGGHFIPAPLLFEPGDELILKEDVLPRRQSSRRTPAPFYPIDDCSPIPTDQPSRFSR